MDKYKNLTEEERGILLSFPTLTAKELEDVNNMFNHYVFYKTVPEGRTLWTSCCHRKEKFYADLQMTETPEHREFIGARHNDPVVCPFCGRHATLKAAGLKKGGLRQDANIIFLHSINGDLFAQPYTVRKDFYQWEWSQAPHYWSAGAYHFKLGRAICFYEGWHDAVWHADRDEGKIRRRSNVRDPFGGGGWGSPNESYIIIHPEAIEQSSLKYCGYFKYWRGSKELVTSSDNSLMRFLTVYCVYPHATEMLLKNGFKSAVSDFVFNGKKNAAAIKWGERDPRKAFGLTTTELKDFLFICEKNIEFVTAYKKLKKAGIKTSFGEMLEQSGTLGGSINILQFVGVSLEFKTTPKRFISYLERYTGGCHSGGYRSVSEIYRHWTDYIEAAKAIGYDLEQFAVCFPRDLQEAHDNAAAEHNRRLQAERIAEQRRREEAQRKADEERAKRDPKYAAYLAERKEKEERQRLKEIEIKEKRQKMYTYEADGFVIRPARSSEEIITEGKDLAHCVGGYAARHMEGKLTICFLRRASAPDTSLITIELDTDGTLRQAHGYKNEKELGKLIAPDQRQEYGFIIEPWLKWIAAGSKRDKQGNPIIKNKNKEANVA